MTTADSSVSAVLDPLFTSPNDRDLITDGAMQSCAGCSVHSRRGSSLVLHTTSHGVLAFVRRM